MAEKKDILIQGGGAPLLVDDMSRQGGFAPIMNDWVYDPERKLSIAKFEISNTIKNVYMALIDAEQYMNVLLIPGGKVELTRCTLLVELIGGTPGENGAVYSGILAAISNVGTGNSRRIRVFNKEVKLKLVDSNGSNRIIISTKTTIDLMPTGEETTMCFSLSETGPNQTMAVLEVSVPSGKDFWNQGMEFPPILLLPCFWPLLIISCVSCGVCIISKIKQGIKDDKAKMILMNQEYLSSYRPRAAFTAAMAPVALVSEPVAAVVVETPTRSKDTKAEIIVNLYKMKESGAISEEMYNNLMKDVMSKD